MGDRHFIELDGERGKKRSLEKSNNWFLPYQKFISRYGEIWSYPHLKIDFVKKIPKGPGDEEGVSSLPWLIKLSPRVRTLLFQNVLYDDGLYILFRQLAYIEFWQKDLFFWFLKWLWNKKIWRQRAEERAKILIARWNLEFKVVRSKC